MADHTVLGGKAYVLIWVSRIESSPMERKGPMIRSRVCLGLLLLLSLAVTDRRALAHAVVLESAPEANASLPGPEIDVRLRFNARVDHARSRLMLQLPDRRSRQLGIATDVPPNILAAHAQGLAPGSYTLRWQVLAMDGHITRGDLPVQIIKPNEHQAAESGGTPAAKRPQQPIRSRVPD